MGSEALPSDNVIELSARKNRVVIDDIKREYEQSFKNFFGYAYSLSSSSDVSKDIVQTVFARLIAKIKRDGALHVENIESYIIRSIRNEFVDRNKRELRQSRQHDDEVEFHPSAETIHFDGENNESLSRAIQKLPTAQRTCIVMYYFNDISVDAISRELGISKSAIKTHIQRARASLNKYLTEIEGGEAI